MKHPKFNRTVGSAGKFLILFFLLAPFMGKTQEENPHQTKHVISLQGGLNQVKDENLHAKVNGGLSVEISYELEKKINSTWQEFHFTLGYSRLKTKLEDLSGTVNLMLNTGYSRSYLLAYGKNIRYYLGPELYLGYHVCYFPNWDDSHLYWADHLSLGARNVVTIPVNEKNQWITSLSFPLFSIYSRPDPYRLYKIDRIDAGGIAENLNSNIQAAHLVNVFYTHFQTEYRFPVFGNKMESFSYGFDFLRVKEAEGKPYYQLIHQLGLRFYL